MDRVDLICCLTGWIELYPYESTDQKVHNFGLVGRATGRNKIRPTPLTSLILSIVYTKLQAFLYITK